ncbi:MAG: ATP-binding protein [Kofleriaceae bacterium]
MTPSLTADELKELAARGERAALDYKRDDYDWSDKGSNAELAKDLMAIANSLGPSDPPGYILVGVSNEGDIVGLKSHLDDASLHQKVSSLLNRTPLFSYFQVAVDGRTVGVYEINAGGRPFYPLKSLSSLQKNCAVFRNGTSTEAASPQQIIDWYRADNSVEVRKQQLELAKLEAERRTYAEIQLMSDGIGPSGIGPIFRVHNRGLRLFEIDSFTCRIGWTELGLSRISGPVAGSVLGEYIGPEYKVLVQNGRFVPPNALVELRFQWTEKMAVEHFRENYLDVQGFSGDWFGMRISVRLISDLGDESIVTHTLSRHPIVR